MADTWMMNAYEQFMDENPDYWTRPDVLADLERLNQEWQDKYGDQPEQESDPI